jgi:hypothetical protein
LLPKATGVHTLLAVVALGGASTAAGPPTRLAFVQVPTSAHEPAGPDIANTILAQRYLLGARIIVAELERFAETRRLATGDFVCATDPAFSHDGERLVFSGRTASEPHLQVWELVGNSPAPTQIVTSAAHCISPIYTPNGHIVFASLLSREYEEHGGWYSFSLYEWALGSQQPTRLTFNPSSDFDPVVLPDGRIAYSAWQHVGNHYWPRGNVALMLINSDGTGVFPLTGNHRGPWLKRGAVPIGSDRVAFIEADEFLDFGAGALVATSLSDPLGPYTSLVAASEYHVAGAAPLPDGRLLLSARPMDGSRPTFGLWVLEEGAVRLWYDDADFHELSPAVGAPTDQPQRRISTVVPGTPHGYALVLNCYETDRTDQHALRRGDVKTVRVIEGLPLRQAYGAGPEFFSLSGREVEPLIRPNSATGYIPARILGEVPPAADGSVSLKLPADRPLRLQLLDEEGFNIINERSWFWVRPNERRVCIGCHENRELSPHNAMPLAARGPAADLTDTAGWQKISFRRDIQPILSASCATSSCHVSPEPAAAMNLSPDRFNGGKDDLLAGLFGPAYANLLARQAHKPFSIGGRRVHPGDSRQSPPLWWLYGRPLGPQYEPAPFERPILEPHPDTPLPEEQLELIRKWIDLGAQYDGESAPGPWPYASSWVRRTEVERDVP